jgi:hypothetical protein
MKKTLIIASVLLSIFTACKKETIEVPVEKIVEKTILVKPTDAIDSAENYLLKTNNGYGSKQNAPAIITASLKIIANSAANLDYITVYGGRNKFTSNINESGYGNDSHIILLCWHNTKIKQVKVFGYGGAKFESMDYNNLAGDDLKSAPEFTKNTYLGTINKSELLARK